MRIDPQYDPMSRAAQGRNMEWRERYCVLVPAFNAAETIANLVRTIKHLSLDVVVVDDGSYDATAELAAREGAMVISLIENRGKGLALRTGFEYAIQRHYDGVITMDSDGQHDPAEIAHLLRVGERQHAGMVLGDRSADCKSMPRIRRWTNTVMSFIVSCLAGMRIPDSQCGFRFIRRELLERVPLRAKRFDIETEMLLVAARHRWKIVSIPVRTIYKNHRSHIRPMREAFRFFGLIVRHMFGR